MKQEMQKYLSMSPFELKNVLIKMAIDAAKASKDPDAHMLNAGRGNPNFLNTTVRKAFSQLHLFAATFADEQTKTADLGLRPPKEGIAKKLDEFCEKHKSDSGVSFLKDAIDHAMKTFKFDADDFVFELTDAARGDFYPSPPRIFPHIEQIVLEYLNHVVCPALPENMKKFQLFATEGATAAMVYMFKSLKENKILNKGDHIAIVSPIFSPYLEIPELKDYSLVEVLVEGSEDLGWQIPDSEIEKLKDKKVKALYLVNPSNPPSVAINGETLKKIEHLVQHERKDLIVLTDTVYATFVDEFHSLIEVVPKNTICVYSFSKYFGVTGWRLGVMMLHEDNIIDKLISELPEKDVKALDKRYKMDSLTPEKIKFIDRLAIDSRDVALAHTGGLSCPQQSFMSLLALFELMDTKKAYKKSVQEILKRRIKSLYDNLGIELVTGPEHTNYYTLIDLEKLAKEKFDDEFALYLTKNVLTVEFLFRLAKETFSIALPGEGFAGPKWSIRISIANLNDDAYVAIGKNIIEIMTKYQEEFKGKR
jgi:aspartate 4-decarboxylase